MKRLLWAFVAVCVAIVLSWLAVGRQQEAEAELGRIVGSERVSVTYDLIGFDGRVVGEKRIDCPSGKVWWRAPGGKWSKARPDVSWWRERRGQYVDDKN